MAHFIAIIAILSGISALFSGMAMFRFFFFPASGDSAIAVGFALITLVPIFLITLSITLTLRYFAKWIMTDDGQKFIYGKAIGILTIGSIGFGIIPTMFFIWAIIQ